KYDGVIKLPPLHKKAVEGVLDHARRHHFKVLGVCQSPIAGKDGNIEFFAHLEWK
ncbi:MAG: TlyA family rRNA (cytidine-2'-O)-methyltransferase, partial [Malacoplasma sp.]|nr:TlyA family rRNA (cytidine-2'-O)-methyltransferase [Malacoplasma sp.]